MSAAAFVRPNIDQLPPYVPGKRAGRTANVLLASNESPYAPLPSVQKRLESMLGEANRYPDMGCTELIVELAAHLSVNPERIAVGNGSSSLIRDLVATVAGPGDEVLFASPSFPYYGNAAIIAGATPVGVPLDSAHRHNLSALANAVSSSTRIVFVCNPNNPTGTRVSRREIEAFVKLVPERVLIVVDEAYIEFCEDETDALPLTESYANVAVLRTFSKAYGLAGLRIGYLVAPAALAAFVRRVSVPFTVNLFAQTAARASLNVEAQSELHVRVHELIKLRDALIPQIQALGVPTVASHANFIFLPLVHKSEEFAAACEMAGVLVRAVGGGVRVTVGNETENEQFLSAVRTWADSASKTAVYKSAVTKGKRCDVTF